VKQFFVQSLLILLHSRLWKQKKNGILVEIDIAANESLFAILEHYENKSETRGS
jgi:hypothetical protein